MGGWAEVFLLWLDISAVVFLILSVGEVELWLLDTSVTAAELQVSVTATELQVSVEDGLAYLAELLADAAVAAEAFLFFEARLT